MDIKILGTGCANCVTLERLVRTAALELGIPAHIEKVTDLGAIAGYGGMRTPGLVIDEELVLSGRVTTESQVTQLLASRASLR